MSARHLYQDMQWQIGWGVLLEAYQVLALLTEMQTDGTHIDHTASARGSSLKDPKLLVGVCQCKESSLDRQRGDDGVEGLVDIDKRES